MFFTFFFWGYYYVNEKCRSVIKVGLDLQIIIPLFIEILLIIQTSITYIIDMYNLLFGLYVRTDLVTLLLG